MKAATRLLQYSIKAPKPTVSLYSFPKLSEISSSNLPNNGFGTGNYYIPKSKFNHWPVYLKVSNTKITTEIRKVQGDILQFRSDLLKFDPTYKITLNTTAGILNIKGNVVNKIKSIFDTHMPK